MRAMARTVSLSFWPHLRFVLLLAAFMLVAQNQTFFAQVTHIYPTAEHVGFLLSLAVLMWCLLIITVAVISALMPLRIAAVLLLITGAACSYFSDQLGTMFDRIMLVNVLQTNVDEAGDLLSGGLWLRLLLIGILPAALLWRIGYMPSSYLSRLAQSALFSLAALLLAVVVMLPYGNQYASFFREHKALRYYAIPLSPLVSATQLLAKSLRQDPPQTVQQVARYAQTAKQPGHAELIIVVVGETARADHFALNGYARPTNPGLAQQSNLLSYTQVSSCGTSTAVSVPCLFSFDNRQTFDVDTARYRENVLDVLQRAGVNVLWRDNNSDSKGVALRVPYEDFRSDTRNPACDEVECRDIGMLVGLQAYIDQQQGDVLIVLHQMGSHGPAYYKRYPKEFEQFTPACQSLELAECTQEEIINAYDNSILYTDYFLNEVIELLKRNTPKFETAMLYMSDHGESLGENGVYLHGLPYFMAPKEQTHVPFLVWVGESSDINFEPSVSQTQRPFSHDAFSCSLLMAFEVSSDILERTPCEPYFVYKYE